MNYTNRFLLSFSFFEKKAFQTRSTFQQEYRSKFSSHRSRQTLVSCYSFYQMIATNDPAVLRFVSKSSSILVVQTNSVIKYHIFLSLLWQMPKNFVKNTRNLIIYILGLAYFRFKAHQIINTLSVFAKHSCETCFSCLACFHDA